MTIKRNANGQQNLNDLRRELDNRENRSAHRMGGNWIASSLVNNCWHESPCPYHFDERAAIQYALYGTEEEPAETQYHAR